MLVRFSAAFFLVTFGCAAAAPPTFSKDVAPILYSRCVECHRPGEAAPMAFTSYAEVRPWAKAIKQAVLTRTMPPWLADPHFGSFRNDRRLPDDAIRTIVAWADAGAPEGNPKADAAMPRFETGWRIGKPDAVFDIGTDFDVPAEGVVSYQYFTVPTQLHGGPVGGSGRGSPRTARRGPSRHRFHTGAGRQIGPADRCGQYPGRLRSR